MGLLDVLAFLTRLPVGPRPMEGVGKSMQFFPVAGLLIALPLALAAYGLALASIGTLLTAALLLALLYLLTGIHHFDGLVDFADAIAKKGSPEERRKVLRDPAVGAAGLLAGILTLLVLAAAAHRAAGFLNFGILLALFASAEAGAKHAMVVAAAFGRPFGEGSGRAFLEEATVARLLLSFTLTALLTFGLWGWTFGFTPSGGLLPAAALLGAGHLVPRLGVAAAHRTLGGVNGDVLGAIHEISRAVLLAAAVVFL
ncbi:MAG: adenosylcobinamide-GDP ribazoletransferase [Halobacteria archaeon]